MTKAAQGPGNLTTRPLCRVAPCVARFRLFFAAGAQTLEHHQQVPHDEESDRQRRAAREPPARRIRLREIVDETGEQYGTNEECAE